MKKGDLIILQQGILKVADLFGDNVRFSYAVAKNDKIIKPEYEAIAKTIQVTPEFSEYETKKIELAKPFAKKDENGDLLSKDGFFVWDDKNGWEKAFEEFKKPYKELLEKRDEQIKQYNELLEEETDIKLHMINENDLPRTITPLQLAGIINMVE